MTSTWEFFYGDASDDEPDYVHETWTGTWEQAQHRLVERYTRWAQDPACPYCAHQAAKALPIIQVLTPDTPWEDYYEGDKVSIRAVDTIQRHEVD